MKPVKMPFDGAIIDASIVLMRRTPFRIEISEPITTSRTRDGYVQVLDLANVYRGTGLINSKFFLAKPEDPFYGTANVFIKKGARNTGLVIDDDHSERAYLFETVQEVPPNFTGWVLDRAKKSDLKAKTLFDVASTRPNEWCLHNKYRPSILFNYFLRNEPKHLFNPQNHPVADNYYGVEPLDIPTEVAWLLLNSPPYFKGLLRNSRSQGNGLRKLQLYEYREAMVPDWRIISDSDISTLGEISSSALKARNITPDNATVVTKILNRYFSDSAQ